MNADDSSPLGICRVAFEKAAKLRASGALGWVSPGEPDGFARETCGLPRKKNRNGFSAHDSAYPTPMRDVRWLSR